MNNINWLGHASFFFTDNNGNKIYFVDPFQLKTRAREKADIIFITHAHPDHFSQNDIDQIIKSSTIIVSTIDVLEKIDLPVEQKIIVKPNENYKIKDFSFSTIPAYNSHPDRLNFHPQDNNWVGYIFNLNGKKIYHSGDTDLIPEMKKLTDLKLDVAFLPIGGTYTMGAREAADAANLIAARITIPMHYKNLNENHKNLESVFKKLVTNSTVLILEELQ